MRKQDAHTIRLHSKKEGKDQESIQSSTTPDLITNGKVTTLQLDITKSLSIDYNRLKIHHQVV